MAWTTPKTDWSTDDLILDSDLNEIGNNLQYLYDNQNASLSTFKGFLKGFEIDANNLNAPGTYRLKVKGGQAMSADAAAVQGYIPWDRTGEKLLSATPWAPGSSSTSPCLAPGATFANDKWFFVFILYNPTTDARDIALDDDLLGGNIAGSTIETTSGYTMWRRIGALKTSTLLAANGFVPVTAKNQKFVLSGDIAARSINQAISTTPTLTTLQDTNTVSLLPDDGVNQNLDFSCFFEIECPSFYTGLVAMWNKEFGAIYYANIGLEMNMYTNTGGDKLINHVDYVPDFNQVYLRCSSSTTTVDVKLISYIDACETI